MSMSQKPIPPQELPVATHWPKGAPFPVRKPALDFASGGKNPNWFANNPVLTRHMDTLSSLFPDGERFFVDAVRAYQKEVKDPALQKEIRAFIGQEARHSEQHSHFNQTAGDAVEWSRARCERLVKFGQKYFPKRFQLAATVCAEHFTATLGEHLLRRKDIHESYLDSDMQRMWLWHAVEENEHKTTAFAVYQAVGGTEFMRIASMVPTTAILLGYLIIPAHLEILRRDGELGNVKAWAETIRVMLGPKGFYTGTLRDYFDWFKPGFKPEDHDTNALLAEWRQRLGFDGEYSQDAIH